jgi:hypothetical protein
MICQKNLPKLVPGINSGINGAIVMRSMLGFVAAAIIASAGFAWSPAHSRDAGAIQMAAGSCTATFNVCVARCRKDNPQDKACPSDHCSPKLAQCKSTGCWQEGQRYGGRQTCGLKTG